MTKVFANRWWSGLILKAKGLAFFGLLVIMLAVFGCTAGNAQSKSDPKPPLEGGFADPPLPARPQVRFWTPAAAISDAGLRRDIDALVHVGFGGIEINGFPPPKGVGPEYVWGTEAWNRLMNTAASQAGKDGVTIDFTNGPRWPIAMPGVKSADDPAALYEMTYGSEVLQPGQPHVGVVPARRKIHTEGTSKLDAILAYRMTGDKVLDPSSLIDLTTKAHIDPADNAKSTVEFTAPSGSDSWVLFTFWEQPAVQKVDAYYVIDHFSAAGAKASNDYWEKVAFPALGANIKYVHSIFNDSLEYTVTMEWTRGMQDFFKQQHGYDITPYLPFIGMASTFPANDIPGFKTADLDLAEKVQHDFRETLTSLYVKNHLEPMEQMADRHGMTVRYQAAYNKPMQIEDSALAVGIPETEALGRSSIDMPRYMAGAVHLAGKPFYSIETSAEFGNQYGQSLEDLLWWNKRAWAGGVNIQRLHGQSYSGEFDGEGSVKGQLPGQAWPGYSAFGLGVSNNWIRQTSPEALHQTLTYMARVNYIMQKKAKVDVAVYDDAPDIYDDRSTTTHGDGNAVYRDAGILNANGFSYEFVSPAMLDLAQATLANGQLGKEGPAYKALIVPPDTAMEMHTVERLKALADAGFKIVFIGNTPDRSASYADQLGGHSDADIRAAIVGLVRLSSVASVTDYASVPGALRRLGVHPDAEPSSPADVLTQHRVDTNGDYYYFYNYNKVSNVDATWTRVPQHTTFPNIDKAANFIAKTVEYSLVGTGKPYQMDPSTGNIRAIPQFTASDGRIRVTVHLAGDEAILVALLSDQEAERNGVKPATTWATNFDAADGELTYATGGKLAIRAKSNANYTVRLNTGRSATASVSDLQPAQTIQDWSLTITSIEAPPNGSTLFQDSVWKDLGPFLLGTKLKPWNEIDPSLARVSGIGTYTGTFNLDRGWGEGGSAYLDLGDVAGAFSVTINGTMLPPQDPANTVVNLGPNAKKGVNTVAIRVATTLYNKVIQEGKPYGLLGTSGAINVSSYRLLFPNTS